MFLAATMKHNRRLIDFAVKLHQQGDIPPNTYVIDLDMIRENTKAILEKARQLNIELFFMTKQFGRNPLIAQAIAETGLNRAVAVDPWEALSLSKFGIKIGHVGHLVQIPKRMIASVLKLNPDYVTVFSYENVKNISEVALQLNKKQKVLLRIAEKQDYIFNGQEGGFTLEELARDLDKLKELSGVEIAGLTSFPCLMVEGNQPKITPNVLSMQKAKDLLGEFGYVDLVMNMPSATSCATLELLKQYGATQGEPGHALTGTTPLHAENELPEKPAIVYVSEVSHHYDDKAYVFGGGFYPRSHMKNALVGRDSDAMKLVPVFENDPSNIDYYGKLDTDDVQVGDTVIYAFRTQIFVTNAQVAVVKNLATKPELLGIYDSKGNSIY